MGLLDNLPDTCTAKRRRRASDGMGGKLDTTPTTLFSDRACWQQRASDQEVDWWRQRGQNVTDKVYFTADPGVDERYVLEIGGETFDVISSAHPDASAGLGVVWRVMCQRTGTVT